MEGLLSMYPLLFLPLSRDRDTIIFFQHIGLENYKKTPPEMFEINRIMFKPNLDVFLDVFGPPDQYKN